MTIVVTLKLVTIHVTSLSLPSCRSVFCALTLFVARQKEHPACKKLTRCCGYLSVERSADYWHVIQLMPLPFQNHIISYLILIQTGFTFLVPACPRRLEKRPLNVCVRVGACGCVCSCRSKCRNNRCRNSDERTRASCYRAAGRSWPFPATAREFSLRSPTPDCSCASPSSPASCPSGLCAYQFHSSRNCS